MGTRAAPSKRRTFTDDQRADAVALLHANGYPDAPNALAHTANVTGVGHVNLLHWEQGQRGNVTPGLLHEKKLDLSERFAQIADAYSQQALDTVQKTSGVQAVTAAAIAVDKMRLLQGLPTAIVGIMPDVLGALRALGIEPASFFSALVSKAEEQAQYKRLSSG